LLEKNDELEESARADIVFCSHYGFEKARDFWEFARGVLYKMVIPVKFWRVPYKDVPKSKHERIEWLFKNWKKNGQMDW